MYNEDKKELAKLLNDYTILMNRLMEAEETKQISAYSWSMIRDMSKKVVENIAQYAEVSVEQVEKWISSDEPEQKPLAA